MGVVLVQMGGSGCCRVVGVWKWGGGCGLGEGGVLQCGTCSDGWEWMLSCYGCLEVGRVGLGVDGVRASDVLVQTGGCCRFVGVSGVGGVG